MKHSDFRSLINEIKQKEYNELYKAIEAHGGSYSWWNEIDECFIEEVEHPIIAVNVNSMFPNPIDVEIRRVFIERGCLVIVGEDKEYGDLVHFLPGDVFAGHLSYVIDLIEQTETVDDVTIK